MWLDFQGTGLKQIEMYSPLIRFLEQMLEMKQ